MRYIEGDRVELVRCSDPYTKLRPGSQGIVSFVDSMGTVHVDWDNGAKLGMVEEAGDQIILVREKYEPLPEDAVPCRACGSTGRNPYARTQACRRCGGKGWVHRGEE